MDFSRISRRHLLQGGAALTLGSAFGVRSAFAADTTIGGAALAAGAGALVTLNRGPLADAQANIDGILARPVCQGAGTGPDCRALLAPADNEYNKRKTIQNLGLVALGVGVIAAGVGSALLLTADDPTHYDRAPRDLDASKGPALSSWLGPDGGGLALAGRF